MPPGFTWGTNSYGTLRSAQVRNHGCDLGRLGVALGHSATQAWTLGADHSEGASPQGFSIYAGARMPSHLRVGGG
ncbi:hypothetical protein J7I98_33750 [Streptomyces sp. ISL-98]|uniref:hypothetical protein n=1 Tax=Streptomyces sp. ISL-98 TaxID=2819192 RepID=UPI001BEC4DDF|nr:hypothetical protein [Streptomyces sp. ISL-98]